MVSVMSSRVLIATCRLIPPSTARYTTPIPPFASTSFSSYRPFNLVEAGIGWSDYMARMGRKESAEGLALLVSNGRFHAEIVTLAIVSLGRLCSTNQKKHILALDAGRRGKSKETRPY